MRVLVCGGREYLNIDFVYQVLDTLDGVSEIIEGGARGVDTIARHWAKERGVPVRTFRADWQKHKKSAGPIRNGQMLREGKPDLVIAFPGGRGTANMVEQAIRAGVPVEIHD